jgi:hypothetical protein
MCTKEQGIVFPPPHTARIVLPVAVIYLGKETLTRDFSPPGFFPLIDPFRSPPPLMHSLKSLELERLFKFEVKSSVHGLSAGRD